MAGLGTAAGVMLAATFVSLLQPAVAYAESGVGSFYGTFSRSFPLPENVDAKGIRAETKEGVFASAASYVAPAGSEHADESVRSGVQPSLGSRSSKPAAVFEIGM